MGLFTGHSSLITESGGGRGPLRKLGQTSKGRKERDSAQPSWTDGRADHPKDIFTIRMLSSEREEIGLENVQSSRNVGRKRECVGYWDCLFLATHLYNLKRHMNVQPDRWGYKNKCENLKQSNSNHYKIMH